MAKDVKLVSLRLTYFKGIKEFEVVFNPDIATISGANATGKTTLFDAWSWLLFGKDSLGKSDFDLKTLRADNSVIERTDHEVSGVLSIDGAKLTLKKVLKENWVKPRGAMDEVFKGNETSYFFDGIPVSQGDYQKRIGDIVDEKLFRLITNVSYFPSLKKEEKRNILTSIAGEVTNEFILGLRPEFDEILKTLGGKDISDFKKKLALEKKRLKEELDQIPIRIDELMKSKPEAVDFSVIEKQISEKEEAIKQIDIAISNSQVAFQQKNEGVQKLYAEINELKTKKQNLVNEATQKAQQKVFDDNSKRRELKSKIDIEGRELLNCNQEAQETAKRIGEIDLEISRNAEKRESLLKEWNEADQSVYQKKGNTLICPVFNHQCSDEEACFKFASSDTNAELIFNKSKNETLADIEKRGLAIKESTERLTSQKAVLKTRLEDLMTASDEKLKFCAKMEQELLKLPESTAETINPYGIPEWLQANSQIFTLQEQIDNFKTEEPDNTKLIESKKPIVEEIDHLKAEMHKKQQIENTEIRIDQLKAEISNYSNELAELERQEFQVYQFNKFKMEEVDTRINGMFDFVKFKLFDVTIEGNEFETCEILINGVPYESANNAARINAGIDIINVLGGYYGISVPIFVDNSESVNQIIPTNSQLIRLVVTTDDKLIIS